MALEPSPYCEVKESVVQNFLVGLFIAYLHPKKNSEFFPLKEEVIEEKVK